MSALKRIVLIATWSILMPGTVFAQATLAGVVKDPSDAVLPGTAVEVSSAALIEKTRRAVTDDSGQYRITDLPPGIYEITYTLNGFTTVRREGVEVTGSGVIAINIEMRVGNVTETLTVTGETPIVDAQTTRRELVLSNEVINVLPATRGYGAILTAIPALMTSGTGQIFSSQTTPQMTFFTTHGGRASEGRIMVDGLNTAAAFGGGGVSGLTYDVTNVQEMQILLSGGLGESEVGGPSINLMSQTGGNTFRGSAFFSNAGEWSSANNVDAELAAAGIIEAPAVITTWDLNGTYGGPIKRDRLWFFTNLRSYGDARPVDGLFANLNAGNPARWDFVPDLSVPSRTAQDRAIYEARLTAQVTPRNKVSGSFHYEQRCDASSLTVNGDGACRSREGNWIALGTTFPRTSPEAHAGYLDTYYDVTQLTWSSPVTNRMLFEAGYSKFHYTWGGFGGAPPDGLTDFIRVTEQANRPGYGGANLQYRGIDTWNGNEAGRHDWRASAAYVTGAHNMKIGTTGSLQMSDTTEFANSNQISYTFNSPASSPTLNPIQFTFRIDPWEQSNRTMWYAIYAQDQWTKDRVTVQGALRYDRAWSWFPAEHQGAPVASRFNAAPITFPETKGVDAYNDISPRVGVAYDVFGNGKTALKVNAGKYLQAATNDENYSVNNPANNVGSGARFVTSTSRSWNDVNGNRQVDCNLMNPLPQSAATTGSIDTCGQWNNLNFGNEALVTTTVNPDLLRGWGVRPWDWQIGVALQQEILPRVSLDVGYNRRWFGNYTVTDNLTRRPEDYDQWTINAPLHPDLPGGGGYPVTYFDINPTKFALPSLSYVTFETDYGKARTAYWHGVDVTANARVRNGLIFQGGTSTGRGVRDFCDVAAQLPELFAGNIFNFFANQQAASCHITDRWATTFRGLTAYTVPKIDVLLSAIIRSTNSNFPTIEASNGASLQARYPVPNSEVLKALGRLPSGQLLNGTTSVDLLVPGQLYGDDRVTQVDLRFAKVLRFGARRLDLGMDLYNLFNSNDVTIYDGNFGTDGSTWLRPIGIVNPRFVRFNVSFDF
jgi:Carboxypeptidase regulatory-like domain